jgi:hypothetical protein
MTYSVDTARDSHDVGFYVAFDGVAERVASEDFAATLGLSGTYLPVLDVQSLSGFSRQLDRDRHVVSEGALTFAVFCPDGPEGADVRRVFRRRGGTSAILEAGLTASSTVVDTAAATWPNGTTIHVDREAIVLGTWGGAFYSGCTRGAHGSEAVAHAVGSTASSVPRFWWTRGVRLVAVYRDTGNERTIWAGNLSESPVYDTGRMIFSATGRINHLLLSPIVTGWGDYEPSLAEVPSSQAGRILRCHYVEPSDANNFAYASGETFLRVDAGDSVGFYWIEDVGASYLDVDLTKRVPSGAFAGQGGYATSYAIDVNQVREGKKVTLRQVGLVNGRCGHAFLKVALSSLGDGANDSVFDVLPGVSPLSTGVYRRRMGAAIPLALVDRASFLQMPGGRDTDVYWLDEEGNLGDFWTEIAWRAGGYIYVNGDGRLAFKRYVPVDVRASVSSYNAEESFIVSDVSTADDERSALARAVIHGNYDPVSGEYRRRLEIVWGEDAGIYERDGSIEIKSKSIKLGSTGEGYTSLEGSFERERARRIHAGRRHSYRMPWRLHEIMEPGARFSLTDSRVVDFAGGGSVAGRYVEVTSVEYDVAALMITVTLDEIPRGWQVCPSAFVASWSSPNLVLQDRALNLGGTSSYADKAMEFPSDGFAAVRIFDASATPPFSASTLLNIVSVSGDTIVTSGTPSFTPANGDVAVYTSSRGVDSTNPNVHGANTEDFAFGASGGMIFLTLSGEKPGPSWG